jgi:hypothetical protein
LRSNGHRPLDQALRGLVTRYGKTAASCVAVVTMACLLRGL